jgi:hypothetical protein
MTKGTPSYTSQMAPSEEPMLMKKVTTLIEGKDNSIRSSESETGATISTLNSRVERWSEGDYPENFGSTESDTSDDDDTDIDAESDARVFNRAVFSVFG